MKKIISFFLAFSLCFCFIFPVNASTTDQFLYDYGFALVKNFSAHNLVFVYDSYNEKMPDFFDNYLFFLSGDNGNPRFYCGVYFDGLRVFQDGKYIYYTNLLNTGLSLNHFTSYNPDYSLTGLTVPNSRDNWIFVFRLDTSVDYYDDGFFSYYQLLRREFSSVSSDYLISRSSFSPVPIYRLPNFESFTKPVTPDNPIIYPLYESTYSLSIQKDKFVEWLLSTGRYVEIAESLASNRVSGFVDVFADYGGNTRAFITNVKKFFQFIGIGQTISDYNAVLTKTQSLYREYQHYIRQSLIDKYNDRTQNTSDIKPDTNSDNTSLITNSDDDTVVVRILRDILRSLIALPNNISNLIESFEIKIEGLENTVNVVNQSGIPDISSLWTYSESDFDTDVQNFANDVSEVQQLPVSYLTNINNNPLMPENMLTDKDNLTVNIPNISGFTVSDNGKTFSTQTTSYVVSSIDYPWLDSLVKKIKRFSGILLILCYLVHLRFKLPDIVRGE